MSKQAHVIDKSYTDSLKNVGFSSENKYRKERDKEYEELENELSKAQAENKEEGDPINVSDNTPVNDEDAVWKKRYGDLRSHTTKKEQELRGLISSLENEVNSLKKQTNEPKFPKTEEEVAEWVSMYPDVAAMIETIAGKTSQTVKQEIAQDLAALQAEKKRMEFQRAYTQLLGYHPDFDDLRETTEFKEWISEQPEVLQDAIYKPKLDDAGVKAAARVIDLYKRDSGLDKPKSKTQKSPNTAVDAARINSRSSNSSPDVEDGTPKFTESQVAKMTSKEFEARWPEIQAAQRKGPPYFVYDITGAAR
jgi:hypothetical protein